MDDTPEFQTHIFNYLINVTSNSVCPRQSLYFSFLLTFSSSCVLRLSAGSYLLPSICDKIEILSSSLSHFSDSIPPTISHEVLLTLLPKHLSNQSTDFSHQRHYLRAGPWISVTPLNQLCPGLPRLWLIFHKANKVVFLKRHSELVLVLLTTYQLLSVASRMKI